MIPMFPLFIPVWFAFERYELLDYVSRYSSNGYMGACVMGLSRCTESADSVHVRDMISTLPYYSDMIHLVELLCFLYKYVLIKM